LVVFFEEVTRRFFAMGAFVLQSITSLEWRKRALMLFAEGRQAELNARE
jgi:hypothetical protein